MGCECNKTSVNVFIITSCCAHVRYLIVRQKCWGRNFIRLCTEDQLLLGYNIIWYGSQALYDRDPNTNIQGVPKRENYWLCTSNSSKTWNPYGPFEYGTLPERCLNTEKFLQWSIQLSFEGGIKWREKWCLLDVYSSCQ